MSERTPTRPLLLRHALPGLFLVYIHLAPCFGATPLPFPFGTSESDTFTGPNDDLSSVQFNLTRPMMFLNFTVSTVFQNTNGDVTFEMPFPEFVPSIIPSSQVPPLAAVYWTDVDTRNGGVDINQLWARVSTKADDLQIAAMIVEGTGSNFVPEDIFVATWYKVEAYAVRVGPQCSFQLSMAYNSQETWVIFSYEKLEFFSAELNNFTAIGFNDGVGLQGELVAIVDNDQTMNDLLIQTNCGIPGTYAYRISQEIEFTTPMPNIVPSLPPSSQPSDESKVPCARVGVIMDESLSMGREQDILPGIIEQVVANLESEEWIALVCSFGFASFSNGNNPYVKGCSTGYDAGDFSYEKTGTLEDGYEAIRFALDHMLSLEEVDGLDISELCLETKTTLITVTDEDRDEVSSFTLQDTLDLLDNNDVIIHLVLNQRFTLTDAIGVVSTGTDTNFILPSESGTFATSALGSAVFNGGFGFTEIDYVSLSDMAVGSVWDVNKIRFGGVSSEAFPLAFSTAVSNSIEKSV